MIAASAISANAYMMEQKWILSSSTNFGRLEDAWRRTIREFDILRTAFVPTPGLGTLQVVTKAGIDDSVVLQQPEAECTSGKSLSTLRLVQNEKAKFTLVWKAHHALFDQWTLVMVKETVERFYKGRKGSGAVQFKPFIRHLVETSSQDYAAEHDTYWKSYLADAIPTPFPGKLGADASPKPHGRITFRTSIQAAHSVTAGIIARAAWALVLSQYTNTDTVVFGTTLSGRNVTLPDVENICGPTTTTVPVRVHIQKNESLH